MIISHQHKFIFIKIRRTASSSLEAFLANYCGEQDIITPMPASEGDAQPRNWEGAVAWWRLPARIPELLFWRGTIQNYRGLSQRHQILRGNFYNHIRARDVKACIAPQIWRSYFKFCCERNPWDKVLSRYRWQLGGGQQDAQTNPTSATPLDSERFSAYLAKHSQSSFPPLSDFSFYTDRAGKPLVDKIIRYENLQAELGEVAKLLGIPTSGKLHLRLKSSAGVGERDYRQFYNQEQQELVAQACRAEIALLNYEF